MLEASADSSSARPPLKVAASFALSLLWLCSVVNKGDQISFARLVLRLLESAPLLKASASELSTDCSKLPVPLLGLRLLAIGEIHDEIVQQWNNSQFWR